MQIFFPTFFQFFVFLAAGLLFSQYFQNFDYLIRSLQIDFTRRVGLVSWLI